MKLSKRYVLFVGRVDPYEGWFIGNQTLGFFQSKQEAKEFKKKWEDEHQEWAYGINYLCHRDEKTGRIRYTTQIKEIIL